MVKYNYETFKKGPLSVLELWAGLTMSLAVFNLLPIPVLDGGHILVIAVESLRRGRRLSLQQQQNFMLAGLAVILCLFVAVMSNDIFKLVHGKLHLPQ